MFGKKKLRKDLPAIDIRKKTVKGFFGATKIVPRNKREQRKIKEQLMKQYPDRYYIDDLGDWNSIKYDSLAWIDRIEEFNAFFED